MRMSRRLALYAVGGGSGIPLFTYSGNYELVTDENNPENWMIRLLTSGTLTFTESGNLRKGVEIWACGGGGGGGRPDGIYEYGGGGGGGEVATLITKSVKAKTPYLIQIGSGGAGGVYRETDSVGGEPSSFSDLLTVLGGGGGGNASGANGDGGDGGSGGGGADGGSQTANCKGGSNGGDGGGGRSAVGGKGKGITTYEFSDASLVLRCGGGGGGRYHSSNTGDSARPAGGDGGGGAGGTQARKNGISGSTNFGGGGGGAGKYGNGGSGGSGIVIIRNKREETA